MNLNDLPEMNLDTESLYKEESFTDQKVGAIRRLTPVHASGARDETKSVLFFGQTQLMTPAGALPLNFEIEAESLEEALKSFPEAAKNGIEKTMEEIRELKRQQASSIVVPGMDSGVSGSKIQMP